MNCILKYERLLFLPSLPSVLSLFGFLPCHASRVISLRGGLGCSGYRYKLFGLTHRVISLVFFLFKHYRFLGMPVYGKKVEAQHLV